MKISRHLIFAAAIACVFPLSSHSKEFVLDLGSSCVVSINVPDDWRKRNRAFIYEPSTFDSRQDYFHPLGAELIVPEVRSGLSRAMGDNIFQLSNILQGAKQESGTIRKLRLNGYSVISVDFEESYVRGVKNRILIMPGCEGSYFLILRYHSAPAAVAAKHLKTFHTIASSVQVAKP